MRSEQLPPNDEILSVYKEARYLSFDALVYKLSNYRSIAGKLNLFYKDSINIVGDAIRDHFLSTGSLKYTKTLDEMIQIGKQQAIDGGGARSSKVRVAVYKKR